MLYAQFNAFVQENLTGFNVIKLLGREGRSLDDFKEITEDLQKVGFKANFISGLMMPFLNGLSDLTYLIVAVLGGLQVLAGRLTIGNMQAFVQYVWQINQPIQNLTQLAGQLQSAKSSLDRIFQLMDEPDEANDATEVLEGDLTGQVIFNHVDFQYVADKPLIHDFNLEVNPGEMVAIVGPTGAGKSTIINLLMRFYDVTAGSISVDGHDIRNLSRKDYRKQFGMVLQDAWLFEGTIKENLRFGNLEATDEEIVEAADGVMVARGDLGVEISTELVPIYQKQIIKVANRVGKPVITATHMLDSMTANPRCTRAEASDVANAVLDGSDCVMLSAESAAGDYPVEACATMARIASTAEKIIPYRERLDYSKRSSRDTVQDAIGISVADASLNLDNIAAIVAFTQGGTTARRISKFRPNIPILAITFTKSTQRKLESYWGVYPILSDVQNEMTNDDELACTFAKGYGIKPGSLIIITAGYPTGEGSANMMKIIEVK